MNTKLYEKCIDAIFDNDEFPMFYIKADEERSIYFFHDFIVKVPKTKGVLPQCGEQQNLTELRIYNETHSDILCPVLHYYRGCIVMKVLDTNLYSMSNYVDLTSFSIDIYKKYRDEIDFLRSNYNLKMDEFFKSEELGL